MNHLNRLYYSPLCWETVRCNKSLVLKGQSSRPASPVSTTERRPQSNWTRSLGISIRLKINQESLNLELNVTYSVFHQFRQATFAYGGSILSSSQILPLPQWSLKMTVPIKVVKIDSKIIISLSWSPSVKQTAALHFRIRNSKSNSRLFKDFIKNIYKGTYHILKWVYVPGSKSFLSN